MWSLGGNSLAAALVPALLWCMACERPATERVENRQAPTITTTAQGRTVHNPGAAERFVLREGVPKRPVFLFSGVLAAARDTKGSQAVLPPSGDRLLIFDAGGRYVRSAGQGRFVRAIAVTAGRGEWIVVERDGGVYSVPMDGAQATGMNASATGDAGRPADGVRQSSLAWATAQNISRGGMSIALPTLAGFQGGFIAARSAFASGGAGERPGAPLLLELAYNGSITAGIDTVTALGDPTLTTVGNSGHVAASDSMFYFAPMTRDEIRAFDSAGRPRWTATRMMTWPRQPAFTPGPGGRPSLAYTPVNLALAAHGGFVYALSYSDSTAQTMRIDAFDRMTGVLARTASFRAGTRLISLDAEGGLWHAPADTLSVIGAPPGTVVVDFALPTFRGDTLRLASLRGKVVLLNIWASWCGPCRDEFPLMAELSRDLPAEDFAVVAVSDDVRESDARRFLEEFDPPFATALARGSLSRSLAYNGLPFTVLVDRDGRVLHRYIGFGGRAQFERLRGDIARALIR